MSPRRPGIRTDVGIVVAIGVLIVVTFVGRGIPPSWPQLLLACVTMALLPALVRSPVPVAVVLAVLAAFSPVPTPAATAAVLTIAIRSPLRTAVAVGAVSTVAHAVQGLVVPTAGLSYAWWLVLDVVVHAALVAAGALARARRELVTSLRERARSAEEDRDRRISEARAHERTLIAREMHDVLAHRLSLVATSAGALEYRPDATPEQVARMAGVVRAGAHQALEELRDVIGVLRSDHGEPDRPQPVLSDLATLVAESREAGTDVRFADHVSEAGAAPDQTGRAAYRIVQEGLTNARKHAAGAAVTVAVEGGPGQGLRIEVRNRLSATASSTPGSGLVGLAERAALAGGTLEHGPTDDGAFRLRAELPW